MCIRDRLQTIKWCNKQKNFTWGIVTTVSILNIFYLDEILNEFDQWEKKNVFLNILEGPRYYNIKNLPQATKNAITKKYSGNERLQSVVNFMNSTQQNEKHWNEFNFWTKQSDNYRNNNFQFTFPEFHSIL